MATFTQVIQINHLEVFYRFNIDTELQLWLKVTNREYLITGAFILETDIFTTSEL